MLFPTLNAVAPEAHGEDVERRSGSKERLIEHREAPLQPPPKIFGITEAELQCSEPSTSIETSGNERYTSKSSSTNDPAHLIANIEAKGRVQHIGRAIEQCLLCAELLPIVGLISGCLSSFFLEIASKPHIGIWAPSEKIPFLAAFLFHSFGFSLMIHAFRIKRRQWYLPGVILIFIPLAFDYGNVKHPFDEDGISGSYFECLFWVGFFTSVMPFAMFFVKFVSYMLVRNANHDVGNAFLDVILGGLCLAFPHVWLNMMCLCVGLSTTLGVVVENMAYIDKESSYIEKGCTGDSVPKYTSAWQQRLRLLAPRAVSVFLSVAMISSNNLATAGMLNALETQHLRQGDRGKVLYQDFQIQVVGSMEMVQVEHGEGTLIYGNSPSATKIEIRRTSWWIDGEARYQFHVYADSDQFKYIEDCVRAGYFPEDWSACQDDPKVPLSPGGRSLVYYAECDTAMLDAPCTPRLPQWERQETRNGDEHPTTTTSTEIRTNGEKRILTKTKTTKGLREVRVSSAQERRTKGQALVNLTVTPSTANCSCLATEPHCWDQNSWFLHLGCAGGAGNPFCETAWGKWYDKVSCGSFQTTISSKDSAVHASRWFVWFREVAVPTATLITTTNDNHTRTCLDVQRRHPGATTGAHWLTIKGIQHLVFCDFETDGGGWTLVASSRGLPPEDYGVDYYEALKTVHPAEGRSQPAIWNGLADFAAAQFLQTGQDAIRFSCAASQKDSDDDLSSLPAFDVDMAFYATGWYTHIANATHDAHSCLYPEDEPLCALPARRDLIKKQSLKECADSGAGPQCELSAHTGSQAEECKKQLWQHGSMMPGHRATLFPTRRPVLHDEECDCYLIGEDLEERRVGSEVVSMTPQFCGRRLKLSFFVGWNRRKGEAEKCEDCNRMAKKNPDMKQSDMVDCNRGKRGRIADGWFWTDIEYKSAIGAIQLNESMTGVEALVFSYHQPLGQTFNLTKILLGLLIILNGLVEFLEDREAGFHREVMFRKLNAAMPRLRYPPKGRMALVFYKIFLACEACCTIVIVLINTHGINTTTGGAVSGVLLLLSIVEGPLQIQVSGAPIRIALVMAMHIPFALLAFIPVLRQSLWLALAELLLGGLAQLYFHIDDAKYSKKSEQSSIFKLVPSSLPMARALYGNRRLADPSFLVPRAVLIDAGIKTITEDYVELEDVGFIFEAGASRGLSLQESLSWSLSPIKPVALMCLTQRPPLSFTRDDFEFAWQNGGSEHQRDLCRALFDMLQWHGLVVPVTAEKWQFLTRYVWPLEVIWSDPEKLQSLKDIAREKSQDIEESMQVVASRMALSAGWSILISIQSFGRVFQPLPPEFQALVDKWASNQEDPTARNIDEHILPNYLSQLARKALPSLVSKLASVLPSAVVVQDQADDVIVDARTKVVINAAETTSIKRLERVRVKVEEYRAEAAIEGHTWPFVTCLGDMLRVAVSCYDVETILWAWEQIEGNFDVRSSGRLKNKFVDDECNVANLHVNVLFEAPSCLPIVAEIQVHHHELLELQHANHKLYKIQRIQNTGSAFMKM